MGVINSFTGAYDGPEVDDGSMTYAVDLKGAFPTASFGGDACGPSVGIKLEQSLNIPGLKR